MAARAETAADQSSGGAAPSPAFRAYSAPAAPGSGGEATGFAAGVAAAEPTSLATIDMESRGSVRRRSVAEDDSAFRTEVGGDEEAPPAPARDARVAQATPPPPPPPPGTGTGQAQQPQTATDAVDPSGPLLIYEAELYLAVNEIRQRQTEAIALVREMRGFIARQDDTSVVLRVPAARFNDALTALERIGDVLHRTVQSHDVTEEFHDTEIRLRNAMAIRDRLQQLLERAGNVQDSLVVERELERITMLIEQMRGRIRFLSDRIAFSTITLRFQGRPTESLGPASGQFRLPFPWLDRLGLSNLLDLSGAE